MGSALLGLAGDGGGGDRGDPAWQAAGTPDQGDRRPGHAGCRFRPRRRDPAAAQQGAGAGRPGLGLQCHADRAARILDLYSPLAGGQAGAHRRDRHRRTARSDRHRHVHRHHRLHDAVGADGRCRCGQAPQSSFCDPVSRGRRAWRHGRQVSRRRHDGILRRAGPSQGPRRRGGARSRGRSARSWRTTIGRRPAKAGRRFASASASTPAPSSSAISARPIASTTRSSAIR